MTDFDWSRFTVRINVKASTDSVIIVRGKEIAFGPAHCADCHYNGNADLV